MKNTIVLALLVAGLFASQKSFAQDDPFLGQIIPVAFNFAPVGYAQCNGQLMSIQQNQALFSLLGTTYGGNGVNTFALPDLRGRTIVGAGSIYVQGQQAGTETTTLTLGNLPAHVHAINASTGAGTSSNPTNNSMANSGNFDKEYASSANATMSPTASTGGNMPFNNMKPSAPVFYIICLSGYFPSRP